MYKKIELEMLIDFRSFWFFFFFFALFFCVVSIATGVDTNKPLYD